MNGLDVVLDDLVVAAYAWGHHSTLRESSDETVKYWQTFANALADKLKAAIAQSSSVALAWPDGQGPEEWAAWLRDSSRRHDPYVQGPMFESLAAWIERNPVLYTIPQTDARDVVRRRGFMDVESGRVAVVSEWTWPNSNGFKNVWIVDAVEDAAIAGTQP